MRSLLRVAIPIAVLACTTFAPAIARAGDTAAAEILFNEGKKLMTEGRYAEACAKFEESQRMDEGIGTLFNLAECHERMGKDATAWGEFTTVASLAKAQGQAAREEAARQRAAALEPRLSKLVVRVPHKVAGLVVKRDDTVVGEAQYNTQIPIDPGEHKIAVTAPKKKSWSTTIRVVTAGSPITLEVPPLEDAPEPVAGEVVSSAPDGKTQRILGATAAGVGVAGLVVGTIFGVLSMGHKNEAKPYCNGNDCWDQRGVDEKHSAIVTGDVSTIAFVAGGVLIAGGAVLWFSAPRRPASEQAKLGLGVFGTTVGAGGTW